MRDPGLQLLLDQIIWTIVVYLTGGVSSGATSFYGLTCLVGAILTGAKGLSTALGLDTARNVDKAIR